MTSPEPRRMPPAPPRRFRVARSVARSPTGYPVIAEVVCVVTDDDLLAPPVETPERTAGRVEFPWFFGPGDRSVVDGARAYPVIEQRADRVDTRSGS